MKNLWVVSLKRSVPGQQMEVAAVGFITVKFTEHRLWSGLESQLHPPPAVRTGQVS